MSKKELSETAKLLKDIDIITKYLGGYLSPQDDFVSRLFKNGAWIYSDDQFYLAKAKKGSYYYMKHNNTTVFVFAVDRENCRYIDKKLFTAQQLRRLISDLVVDAKCTKEYINDRIGLYQELAREIAENLGRVELSEIFCGVEFWKNYYEDDKIIVESEQSIERDVKVHLKSKNGVRLVLDEKVYLDGKWTGYVFDLARKARQVARDRRKGIVDDAELFN